MATITSTIPTQFAGTTPNIDKGNLSPLQLAAAYYMNQGIDIPFFVNAAFLEQFKIFCTSGQVTPANISAPSGAISVISKGDAIYIQRQAPDCGPDEIDRYEEIYIGQRNDIAPNSWSFNGTLVRGGSVAQGAGGPWGTGGLTSQDPTPNNGVDRQPDIVTNVNVAYGVTSSTTVNNGIA
jgi:hypothetical protein